MSLFQNSIFLRDDGLEIRIQRTATDILRADHIRSLGLSKGRPGEPKLRHSEKAYRQCQVFIGCCY